jgi:hypothetical protein
MHYFISEFFCNLGKQTKSAYIRFVKKYVASGFCTLRYKNSISCHEVVMLMRYI